MSTFPDPLQTDVDSAETQPAEPKSFHSRVMVWLVVVTIAGCCWLISSGQGAEEGHQAWRTGSVLRGITTLMAMNFEYPTRTGTEVKWLVQGLGAAAALLVAVTAWYVRRRPGDEEEPTAETPAGESLERVDNTGPRGLWSRPAWDLAPMALLALTGWMMLSALWSPWWEASLGEGVRQLVFTIWTIGLGRTLTGRGVRHVVAGLVAVLAITAVIGIWYYFERNPMQRLKFPIGNPIFMAACLLPGVTLILGWALGAAGDRLRSGLTCASGSLARRALTAIGAAAGLAAMLWALKLTDSRGPQLGLVVGLLAGVCLWLRGRARRVAVLVIAVCVIAGVLYVQSVGPPAFIARRITTVSFRQYAWSYALRLFAEQPIAGKGQAGYLLLSQRYASVDAQEDPQAFASNLHGHAHNEWIEILADLGIVGFVLMAAALAATLWCAVVAVREARDGRERGLAVGLAAALIAIAAGETTDVGLRMPGLPVIFYTVVGLIWAQARATRPPVARVRRLSRGMCWAGVATALVGSWSVATAAEQDWKGALAERSTATCIDKEQWDEALSQAALAGRMRLSVEARLAAAYDFNLAAYLAAAHRWEQMREMLGRLDQAGRPSSNIVELAKEDSAAFTYYVGQCIGSGQQLLQRIPAYPMVAGRVAEALLLWQNVEIAEQRLGLRKDVRSFLEGARHYTQEEFGRDPTNSFMGMRLLQLSANQPIGQRIDILRVMLRGGPQPLQTEPAGAPLFEHGLSLDLLSDFEPALMALMQDTDYSPTLDKFVKGARAATTQPVSAWPDPYVPETLRLAARDRKLKRVFSEAVELADLAAGASEKIVAHFPAAPARALVDRTRYLLLAFPDDPEKAVASCRQAIARWPADVDRRVGLELKRSLAFYLLASGDEEGARRQLASLDERLTPQQMDRLIGAGLGELCQTIAAAFAAEVQPKWLPKRLERSIELVPDWSVTRWLAANLAFARKDSQDGISQIEALEKVLGDPDQVAAALRAIAERFPQDSVLTEFVKSRLATRPAAATAEAPEGVSVAPALPYPVALSTSPAGPKGAGGTARPAAGAPQRETTPGRPSQGTVQGRPAGSPGAAAPFTPPPTATGQSTQPGVPEGGSPFLPLRPPGSRPAPGEMSR